MLGLYDLNSTAFARLKLSLPAEEINNHLPDILDEAIWQMPLWKRLQLPDGGVRGGYGDGWGCYRGETSSMLKYAGVYDVDHETTLHYAAAVARAARVLVYYDNKLSAEYLASSQRDWTWAESHAKADDAAYKKVLEFASDLPKRLRDKRALAAVELLAATGDPIYDAAFKWLLNFEPTKKMVPNWFDWPVTEQYIDFARYPLHNENCFNQTTVPAACYWFYLASRP